MYLKWTWMIRLILLGVIKMSHYDKKFKEESQDARRRDQHEEVHPDEKSEKHTKPTDKQSSEHRKK